MNKVKIPPIDTDVKKIKLMFEILTLFFNQDTSNLAIKLIKKYISTYKCVSAKSYYDNCEDYFLLLTYSINSHTYHIGFDSTPEKSIEIEIILNNYNQHEYLDEYFLSLNKTYQTVSDITTYLKEVFISLSQKIKELEELEDESTT